MKRSISISVDGLHGVRFGARQRYGLNESVFESGPFAQRNAGRPRSLDGFALGYPPDMVPNGLLPMPRFAINDIRSHAIIDTDRFVEGRMELDFDKIDEQLSAPRYHQARIRSHDYQSRPCRLGLISVGGEYVFRSGFHPAGATDGSGPPRRPLR